MQGWIKLHRCIIDNRFYFSEKFTKTQAWIDLLLLANHKPTIIFIRNNEINLERGQLAYAKKTLAKRWKWNERTVEKFLNMLQKNEMIQYRKSNITTVISIKNYDLYQGSTEQDTEQDTEQSTNQSTHRIHTDKNDNNDNNENNGKEIYTEDFEKFWLTYDYNRDKKKTYDKWKVINDEDKQKISEHLPKYISSTPDKKFRKSPLNYLLNESWNDEIIMPKSEHTYEEALKIDISLRSFELIPGTKMWRKKTDKDFYTEAEALKFDPTLKSFCKPNPKEDKWYKRNEFKDIAFERSEDTVIKFWVDKGYDEKVGEKYYAHYAAKGWIVNGSEITDWRKHSENIIKHDDKKLNWLLGIGEKNYPSWFDQIQ